MAGAPLRIGVTRNNAYQAQELIESEMKEIESLRRQKRGLEAEITKLESGIKRLKGTILREQIKINSAKTEHAKKAPRELQQTTEADIKKDTITLHDKQAELRAITNDIEKHVKNLEHEKQIIEKYIPRLQQQQNENTYEVRKEVRQRMLNSLKGTLRKSTTGGARRSRKLKRSRRSRSTRRR